MNIRFTIRYQCTDDDGSVHTWTSFNRVPYVDSEDRGATKRKLLSEFGKLYESDPNFKIVAAYAHADGTLDLDLMERMQAVRSMCELGHKVRANTGIRNRQPLGKGYIAFADQTTQDWMIYQDSRREFAKMIENELNVLHIEFIDEQITKQIFNYNVKPNFKVLGPKGFGKQAQGLKATLQAMTVEEKNELYAKLKNGEVVDSHGIPLTISDIEVEFTPKENLTSSTGKVGALVLDTTMTETLLEFGFVAEFRSAVQALRREMNLEITDQIFLEVYCDAKKANTLDKYRSKYLEILVATGVDFFPVQEVDALLAHQLFFHGETLKTKQQVDEACQLNKLDMKELSNELFYVSLYKEGARKPKKPEFKTPMFAKAKESEEKEKFTPWREAIEKMTRFDFDESGRLV